jgi:hypothetical protein
VRCIGEDIAHTRPGGLKLVSYAFGNGAEEQGLKRGAGTSRVGISGAALKLNSKSILMRFCEHVIVYMNGVAGVVAAVLVADAAD